MHQIPSTIITEPFNELSFESLKIYLDSLNNEIESLMVIYPNATYKERKEIVDRSLKCHEIYEELYGYYLPLFTEKRREIVKQFIQESTVFEKYRHMGIIK